MYLRGHTCGCVLQATGLPSSVHVVLNATYMPHMLHQVFPVYALSCASRSGDAERGASTLSDLERRALRAAEELDAGNSQTLLQQALYASQFALLADVLLSGEGT